MIRSMTGYGRSQAVVDTMNITTYDDTDNENLSSDILKKQQSHVLTVTTKIPTTISDSRTANLYVLNVIRK